MTENVPRKYNYQDKEFIVDKSKGCYLEVAYKEQMGYLGVNLQGTKESPYCWYTDKSVVTAEGLKVGNVSAGGLKGNLDALCLRLVKSQEEWEARNAFDPEDACEDLDEFFKELGE